MTALIPERLEHLLVDIPDLPTLPEVPARVLQMAGDDEAPLKEITHVIERDPALTTNILRVANSAYYAFRHRVSTLQMAVSLLGLNEITNLVCTVSVMQMFRRGNGHGAFDGELFRRHSLGTAVASKLLSDTFRFETGGTEFVAGLIHDIGILVCAQYLPGQFRQIHDVMDHTRCAMTEAETDVLGTTHAELGAWLADRWGLPRLLVEAIQFHHVPLEALAQAEASALPGLAAVVHLADRVAAEESLPFPESSPTLPPLEEDVAWRIVLAESSGSTVEQVQAYASAFSQQRSRLPALLAALT